ncbi:MAG TPA: type I pantothenate kinase [Bryobacteraceae bacterium]|jgi:type I pantothenate kinase|nr:type I pantothenate kinase [Bryobacteraceae bacterium]
MSQTTPSPPIGISRYIDFTREEWSRLRAGTPLLLSEADLTVLRGVNERVSIDEVIDVYLPLARLLNLYYSASQDLFRATAQFLGHAGSKVPYLIGLAGSVAVGKSTTARVLRELIARMPPQPRVDLISTDGFLLPTRILKDRGLMDRKGFPESFDTAALVRFLSDVKSGRRHVQAPVYSHVTYDIVPDQFVEIDQPDAVIIEGLNILQTGSATRAPNPRVFVSDFFDFSVYVDADEEVIRQWYENRLLTFRESAFRDPASYFHHYASLSVDETRQVAEEIWRTINGRNLVENILPTRERADLILRKAPDHSVESVRLRRI